MRYRFGGGGGGGIGGLCGPPIFKKSQSIQSTPKIHWKLGNHCNGNVCVNVVYVYACGI